MRKNKLLLLLALLLTAVTGAWAEEQVVYTLDGTQTASNKAYTTAGVVNQGGMTWMVTGNTSMNPWRIGGKSLSGVDRSVWSESSLDETVTKVTLEFGTASSITVNSITMTVAGDDGFSDVIDTKAVTFSANNTVDVTPTEGKEWKNAYYRFVFNVTVSGSSNKYFQLKSIKFYNDPDAQQQGGSTEPVAGTFTVTMKDGTVDAKNWSIASGEKSAKGDAADGLTGLSEGDQVTLTYNGRLKVKGVKATSEAPAEATPALSITSPSVGQVIGSDGKNYAYGSLPTGVTKVAMIAYVNGSNGLAIALADEGQMNWETAKSTCEAKTPAFTNGTWKLPSQAEWNQMFSANGGSEDSYTGLYTAITTAGGTTLQEEGGYWSSTVDGSFAYYVNLQENETSWRSQTVSGTRQVRACLAFTVEPSAKTPATVTTAPTGAAVVGVGKTTALVSGGAAEGGTMMYKVTTENTKPASTDGFSEAVPTAKDITASGKVYVWYYVKGDDTHSDSEIAATAIEVPVADIVWDVTNVRELYVSGTYTSYEKEGITLSGNGEEVFASWSGNGNPTTSGIRFDAMASGGYTFTAPAGKKFTKIEMTLIGPVGWDMANLGDGWAFNIDWETYNFTATWTGSAASAVGLLTGAGEFQGDKAKYIAFYLSE